MIPCILGQCIFILPSSRVRFTTKKSAVPLTVEMPRLTAELTDGSDVHFHRGGWPMKEIHHQNQLAHVDILQVDYMDFTSNLRW